MSNRNKIRLTFVGILILTVIAGVVDWPKGPDINLNSIRIPYEKELKVHLGLDLQGGTHLVYEADLSKVDPENYDSAMDGVRDVIERRVNGLGVSEPVVQTVNVDNHRRLIIELAGVHDVNQAIAAIGETPSLDFREQIDIPAEGNTTDTLKEGGDSGSAEGDNVSTDPAVIDTESLQIVGEGDDAKIVDQEGNEVNIEALTEQLNSQQQYPDFALTKLSGQHLNRAEVQFDQQTGLPVIAIEFNSEGKDLFAEITERNVGKPLAIYLDGFVISAPIVNTAIRDGNAIISGDFSIEEARDLAMRLNAGALPVPIEIVSQNTVGPTLGKISIEKSFLAGIIGLLLVCIFMIIFYRLPGVLAVFSLIIYTLLALALFKLIPITLTLAGIAGFILSIGMAVDANVLIFERIKEELRLGKTLGSSIDSGFDHAWTSIRDSNLSTILTCGILAWFGVGIIKGFAITLGLGVLLSMFSAIYITKTLLHMLNIKWTKNRLWMFGISKRKES